MSSCIDSYVTNWFAVTDAEVRYAMVVAFAMIRNALERPYSWLLRPRFFVYILLAADVFWLRELGWNYLLEYLLWGCNLVLSVKMASGFFAIRRAL